MTHLAPLQRRVGGWSTTDVKCFSNHPRRWSAGCCATTLERRRDQDPLAEGLVQLDGYLAGLGLDTGWLVTFDRRTGQPPLAERLLESEQTSPGGRRIRLLRL